MGKIDTMDEDLIVEEGEDYVAVTVGYAGWEDADGLLRLEEQYPIGGEIWRVHKGDPDPYPSDPHAHCIEGRFKGCKLHLGTRQLFTSNNKPLNRFLRQDQFDRLIVMLRKKFPEVELPLSV